MNMQRYLVGDNCVRDKDMFSSMGRSLVNYCPLLPAITSCIPALRPIAGLVPTTSSLQPARTKFRFCYERYEKTRNRFPRPSEVKRIRVHGWETRLSSASGRRIIMRRILKGRHVLSH